MERRNCLNCSVSDATITMRVAAHIYPPSCYPWMPMITLRFLRKWPIRTVSSRVLWFDWRPVETTYVRYWPKADIQHVAFDVAFGGKADMAYCSANVRHYLNRRKPLP